LFFSNVKDSSEICERSIFVIKSNKQYDSLQDTIWRYLTFLKQWSKQAVMTGD